MVWSAAGALIILAVGGEAAAAACDRERREVRSAEAMVSMTEYEVAERRRTVGYSNDLRQQGPEVGYQPPRWLQTESLASLGRAEAELDRRRDGLEAANSALSSCLAWAWRDAGSPSSGGPVAGYVPRGEPGRSALRGDMVGDFSPGGSSRPYRRANRYREAGPLGADPSDTRDWRRDTRDDRRDRADDRRDRRRDSGRDKPRRSGSDRDKHRAPDEPFYDPPQ